MTSGVDVKTEDRGLETDDRREREARAGVYALLSRIFREAPTPELLAALRSPTMEAAFAEAGVSLDAPEGEQGIDDLAVEFTRLFLGPGPHISPHESVQAAPTGCPPQLWSIRTAAVKRFYESTGLSIADSTFMPDHVSIEFEFMSRLIEREARARRDGDESQAGECAMAERKFLSEHLGAWFPKFAESIAAAALLPFYRQAARFTKDFLNSEMRGGENGA